MNPDLEFIEEWLPVVGYEGIYEVSNLGRVRSLARRLSLEGMTQSALSELFHVCVSSVNQIVTGKTWRKT